MMIRLASMRLAELVSEGCKELMLGESRALTSTD